MSGTSLDGLDISLIKSDGIKKITSSYNITYKYSQQIKDDISFLIKKINKNQSFDFSSIEEKLNDIFLKKIKLYFKKFNIKKSEIDIIGLHGQTILHKPKKNISIQIGCGKFLAKALKIPVVSNFRNADIKKGGQGAPLVPIFHKAIFEKKKISTAVINIGGISNITWIGDNNKIYSTDIGPGNVLIDQFCMTYYNIPFDRNGKLAKKGKINKSIVSEWMNLPFVKKKLPKSFDNYTFKIENYITKAKKVDKNILANLTMYSAKLIADISKYFPQTDRWIICGGGALNKQMMKNLKSLLLNVEPSEKYGWDSKFIESQAFAYLAIRKLKKLPSTFKSTTGTSKPVVCGELFSPIKK